MQYRNSEMDRLPPRPFADADSGIPSEGGGYVIDRLLAEERRDCTNLHRDVQTDVYATAAVISRRMTYASQEYPSWTDALTRVALGAVLLVTAREIEEGHIAHFLHLAVGGIYLRSHDRQTHIYENGAFRPFSSFATESLIRQCKEYAANVEACVLLLGVINRGGKDDEGVFAAIDLLFQSLTPQGSSFEGGVEAFGLARGSPPKRGKRMRRCSVTETGIEAEPPSVRLDERSILSSLSIYPVSKKESTQMSGLEGRGYQAEVNSQVIWRMLKGKIESAAIFHIYAKYLDVARTPEPGLALADVCLIYDPSTSHEREGRNMKQVAKKPTNNIYTYIAHAILGDASTCVSRRLGEFVSETFYKNEHALNCTLAGLAISIIGGNVRRCFWTIGSSGAGQTLLTTLIHNALNPMHSYAGCDALRCDGELSKALSRATGYCVLTAIDEAGGRDGDFRNISRCLYKKICPGGEMMRASSNSGSEKPIQTRGMMRFQTSQLPSFRNAGEEHWGGIYSRSLVVKMKAKFVSVEEYAALPAEARAASGVFPMGDDLAGFLASQQAAGAFVRVIYAFMNRHTIEDCRQIIEDYSRNEGTTWAVMRAACGLSEVAYQANA